MRRERHRDHPRRSPSDHQRLRDAAVDADLVILIAGWSAGTRRLHRTRGCRSRVIGSPRSGSQAGSSRRSGNGRRHGCYTGSGSSGLPGVRGAHLRHLRSPMPCRSKGLPRERSTTTAQSGSQACFVDRHGRLGAGPARSRRRRHHRHPTTSRRRRADIAGAGRRTAGRLPAASRARCR